MNTRPRQLPRPNPPKLALAALAALLVLAPSGLSYHLSVGAEDAIGVRKAEPPADTEPEVYERGTRTDCGPEADPSDPGTLARDGFCGELVYNEAFPGLEAVSPRDQAHLAGVTIDLQMASYVGLYGTTTCEPWCHAEFAYRGLHDAGRGLVFDRGGDQAWDDDGGTQAYGGNVHAASPMQAYAAAGQPWLLPLTDTSFVAFVTDRDGDPVGPGDLEGLVEGAAALDERARAKVCAFTPDAHVGTHAPSSGACELTLDWMGGEADGGAEPCRADTYVCGAVQPAWRSTSVCPMWHAACYLSDAWNSAHHFAVWHGVVAPSPPDGCPAREPGFDTRPGTFLAHDLDVYEPPSDGTPARGVPHYWDEAAENVPGLGPLRDGRAPDVADTPTGRRVQATPAFAQHEPEPNADEWLGIEESTGLIEQDRTLTNCQRLASGEDEADPWVNVVDAHVTRSLAGLGTPAGDEPEPDHEPRPAMRVTGHVGLFADVDDDGAYEQAPGSATLDEVEEFGAYPILWDHHPGDEGCEFRDGTPIGELTSAAGYGEPTGLAVTVRLSDGALVETQTGRTLPAEGPTAFALLSAGLDEGDATVQRVLEEADDRVQAPGERSRIVVEDAFQGQCGEPTGGFTSTWEIVGQPLEGDGVAAAAILTASDPDGDGTAPGGETVSVPPSPVDLAGSTHVWWDVDPFRGAGE